MTFLLLHFIDFKARSMYKFLRFLSGLVSLPTQCHERSKVLRKSYGCKRRPRKKKKKEKKSSHTYLIYAISVLTTASSFCLLFMPVSSFSSVSLQLAYSDPLTYSFLFWPPLDRRLARNSCLLSITIRPKKKIKMAHSALLKRILDGERQIKKWRPIKARKLSESRTKMKYGVIKYSR